MYRFSTSCLGLAVLIAFACGAPAELDESLFPATYSDDETGSAAGGSAPSIGGSGAVPNGTGGAPSVVGGSGSGGIPTGSSGSPPVSGASGGGGLATGGGSTTGPDGCPTDISVLFNRPGADGGCAGGLCHQPGVTPPDLVSPNPLPRLLNVQSPNCAGYSYIGATPEESLIFLKITTPPMGCGLAMPFTMPEALSAEDEACITAWVTANAGG